ncbi:unnamed protein product [Clonostachys rosea]|uniref:Zn(2)-C6 fungal-type domain-containing protein n=1 Tax=Bionectria ochroleuca TaxID=29856 RepID=A0ABY6UE34_BIOOC|nr:unnamed protein product [Clonostachys rosea]
MGLRADTRIPALRQKAIDSRRQCRDILRKISLKGTIRSRERIAIRHGNLSTETKSRYEQKEDRMSGLSQSPEKKNKCDETQPQCVACVQRGLNCIYQRPLVFKGFNEKPTDSPELPYHGDTKSGLEGGRLVRASPTIDSGNAIVRASHQYDPKPHKITRGSPPPDCPISAQALSLCRAEESSFSTYDSVSKPAAKTSLPSLDEFAPRLHLYEIRKQWKADSIGAGYPNVEDSARLKPFPRGGFGGAETNNDGDSGHFSNYSPPHSIQTPSSSTSHSKSWGESPRSTSDCSSSQPRSFPLRPEVEEALLMYFGQQVLPRTPVGVTFPQWFYKNRCFRAAVLALSSSFLKLDRNRGNNQSLADVAVHAYGRHDKINWLYYDTAVKTLNEQLESPHKEDLEQLASAALLLAYHDIEVGTPLGVRNHACGLDALASRMDFGTCSTPGLFKAWRMLRCDRKFSSLATRKTITAVDAYDMSSVLDQQIAIREVLIGLWKLHSRYFMEATFLSNSQMDSSPLPPFSCANVDEEERSTVPSPSERVSQWLQLVLNRDCDTHQAQQKDFYSDSLTRHVINQRCTYFAKQLDQWYEGVAESDLPMVKISTDSDFVTSNAISDVLVTYRLANESRALDHILYLLSRMICNYLRSVFNPGAVAPVSEAWAKVILGIICGMNFTRQNFTLFRVDMLLLITALLSEGTRVVMIILEHVIPHIKRIDDADPGFFTWSYLKTILHLMIQERNQGRTIRLIIDDSIQDSEQRHTAVRHRLVAFGDFSGEGQFRDVYSVE